MQFLMHVMTKAGIILFVTLIEDHTYLHVGVTLANVIFIGKVGDSIEVNGEDAHVLLLKDCRKEKGAR